MVSGFSVHTIPDSYRIKKISALKSGFKKLQIRMPDTPDTCGRKQNPQRKSCGFKNIRIRVDVALIVL